MTYILLHHPGCGSSKKGLELLQQKGITPTVRKYMTAAERLNAEELRQIAAAMGVPSPRAFLRQKDAQAAGLAETASDDEVYEAMAANPKLIQRPIGINGKRAILGRPNERLLDIL